MNHELENGIEKLGLGLGKLLESLHYDEKKALVADLEGQMAQGDFWDDQEAAQSIIRKLKATKGIVDSLGAMKSDFGDLSELSEMADGDDAQESELLLELGQLERRFETLELEALFSGPHDSCGALLSVQAGTGGTDANDFAEMLMRMYLRWAEAKDMKAKVIDLSNSDEAGIKNVTIQIDGHNAYGLLQAEVGVHRLIRISPFNAAGKRQTSFAGVDVLPEVGDDDAGIEILDKDLRIDTYRAGGKGGQHVNTSDSAVRITHIPSGVVVQCQNERSQHKNKSQAMKVLKARLMRLKEMEREKEIAQNYNDKGEINFGSQIRTYTLQPYTLVKDHRTAVENGNVQGVLDGKLDDFMEGYLRYKAKAGSRQ